MPDCPGRKVPSITFATPTVFIQANDFTAENLTFANSAGAVGQAVALTIMGDRGIFRNCRFLGYQDTLLPQAGRQYFDRCYIEGATDFIFGGSAAYFDHCTIHATGNGYLTAANTPKDQRYGYVFDHCKIDGAENVTTYLGRPWRPYAATVFLNSEISNVVRPQGWNNWNDPAREKDRPLCRGYPAPEGRVPWKPKPSPPPKPPTTRWKRFSPDSTVGIRRPAPSRASHPGHARQGLNAAARASPIAT